MGKTEKNRKENHATKVPNIPKTKRQKCGMNKTKVKASKINAVMKARTSPDPYPCTIFSPRFIRRSLGFIEKIVDSKSFC
jgi:hypothetical protein